MASNSKKGTALFAVLFIIAISFFVFCLFFSCDGNNSDDLYGTQIEDTGMRFKSMEVDIKWNNDRSCEITQEIEVEFFEVSHGIFVDIPVNSGEKVRDLKVKTSPLRDCVLSHESSNRIVRARIGDEDRYFSRGDTLVCTVTYNYLTPKHSRGDDILALMAIGRGWTCRTENAVVTMTYPAAPKDAGDEYGIWIAGEKINDGDSRVAWLNDNKTVRIEVGALSAYSGVEIVYEMPKGVLKTRIDGEFWIALVVGAVLIGVAILIKLLIARNKPLTPIVDYYPPRINTGDGEDGEPRIKRMLPVQMGKIIDDNCSNDDVTSLIFYWASKGFLEIDEREDDTYFIKNKRMSAVTGYERRMFAKLFQNAVDREDGRQEVSLVSLTGKFSGAVTECAAAVNKEYSGKLYKRGISSLSAFISVLAAAFGACMGVLTSLRVGAMFNLIGLVCVVPAAISAAIGTLISKYYFKLNKTKRNAFIIGHFVLILAVSFAVTLVVPLDVMGWLERIVLAVTMGGTAAIAPFIRVRTPEYNEMLNSILGFRDFLRDAEKEKLEMLIADDPQYYYDILPYANVLGVSDIWKDKFKDIALAPPTYYRSYRGGVFDIFVIHSLTRSVGSSLTYVPKSSGGSFSSHSGGGGGGGFSGGSFGGGGGGRW